jgi:hypothetical protein
MDRRQEVDEGDILDNHFAAALMREFDEQGMRRAPS